AACRERDRRQVAELVLAEDDARHAVAQGEQELAAARDLVRRQEVAVGHRPPLSEPGVEKKRCTASRCRGARRRRNVARPAPSTAAPPAAVDRTGATSGRARDTPRTCQSSGIATPGGSFSGVMPSVPTSLSPT